MSLTAKDTGSGQNFDPVPEGMHHAICYALYDLGTQYNEKYGKFAQKVLITWELPDERIEIEGEGEKPRAISKKYTLSLHEKAILRKDLESWRGKSFTPEELVGFSLTKLLGVNCMLQVIHNKKETKIYSNITSIVPLMKNMEKKEPENRIRYFSFDEHDIIPEDTPGWIIDIIKSSEEWRSKNNTDNNEESPFPPEDNDGIPF